jgi:hypothetical protein
MDEFEKRLKEDAGAIRATVSPELKSRIDASLRGVEPIRPVAESRSSSAGLWWASSLTGLAAAVLVIVLVNMNAPDPAPVEPVVETTVPDVIETPILAPMLDVRTAEFTSPLEEELLKLQSDLEKARESVREDLEFSF